jgi:hypothetical protein
LCVQRKYDSVNEYLLTSTYDKDYHSYYN